MKIYVVTKLDGYFHVEFTKVFLTKEESDECEKKYPWSTLVSQHEIDDAKLVKPLIKGSEL